MKKRIVIILMCTTWIMMALSGCGKASDERVTPAAEETETATETETEAEAAPVETVQEETETAEPEETVEEEPHEHEWIAATLEAPRTCSICGETEGDPVECKEIDIKSITNDEVENWKKFVARSEAVICEKFTEDNQVKFAFYDYDGNILNEGSIPVAEKYWSWGISMIDQLTLDDKVGLQIALLDQDDNIDITLYDTKGNLIKEDSFSYYVDEGHVALALCDDPRYLAEVVSTDHSKAIQYLDTETLQFIDPSEAEYPIWWTFDFDKSKYENFYKLTGKAKEDIGGYFVKSADGSQYGFLDKDFNELKMYKIATNFNLFGYAIVSEDGQSFDIIDTEFNTVAKDFIQGDNAWLTPSTGGPGVLFGVLVDDAWKYYYIK